MTPRDKDDFEQAVERELLNKFNDIERNNTEESHQRRRSK